MAENEREILSDGSSFFNFAVGQEDGGVADTSPAPDMEELADPESGNTSLEASGEQEVDPAVQDPAAPEGGEDNWETRARYWQSQFDRLNNTVGEVADLIPVARYLKDNPSFLANGLTASPGQTGSPDIQQVPGNEMTAAQNVATPPEEPARPANYDEHDAWNDPTSESFKYRKALDKHQIDLVRWETKQALEPVKALQQQMREREAMSQRQQELSMIAQDVQMRYGATPHEAAEFVNVFSDPNSVSMDNLWKLYRVSKSQGASQEADPRAELLRQRRQRLQGGSPAAAGSGASDPGEIPEDEIFGASLISASKRAKQNSIYE